MQHKGKSIRMIIAVFGLPGTGKSFFAKRLASDLGAEYLSTDKIRKQLQKTGKYSTADKEHVYNRMLELATTCLKQQQRVVVDGTFSKHNLRAKLMQAANNQNVAVCWIQTMADEATVKQRVSQKREDSEADYTVYQKIKTDFDEPYFTCLLLNSGHADIDYMISEAKQYIFSYYGSTSDTATDQ